MNSRALALSLFLASGTAFGGNNVLLIIADDYGIDSSSLYNNTGTGATLPPTPYINALASGGVLFTHAYSTPVCSPARACMVTGRYGYRTGVGNVVSAAAANSLPKAETTLPDVFAANSALGFQLAQFGKWHLSTGVDGNRAPSTVAGWPYFAGSLLGALTDYNSWTKVITNGIVAGTSTTTSTTYATTDLVNDAVTYINARKAAGQKYFVWLAFNAPHTPFHTPPTSLHSYGSNPGNARRQFEAMVEALDTEIGRLLAAVDRSTTDILFLGDNGTPGSIIQPPFTSSHAKDTLYEGGTRVPFLINGPSVVAPGRSSDALVHVTDVYSTVLDLAGVPQPTGVALDSRSLLSVVKNQAATNARIRIFNEGFDQADATYGGHSLRDDRYKLIHPSTGSDEFYDLQADPYENTNLAASGVSAMTATRQSYYYRLRFELDAYSTGTPPVIANSAFASGSFSLSLPNSASTTNTLWRCTDLTTGFWSPVTNATSVLNGGTRTFTDPTPPADRAYYSVTQE